MVNPSSDFSSRLKTVRRVAATLLIGVAAIQSTVCFANDELPPQLNAHVIQGDLGIVSTGCPEATRAAVDVLERGGNAVDRKIGLRDAVVAPAKDQP